MRSRQRLAAEEKQESYSRDVLLPVDGPNTILVNMLDAARYGISKSHILILRGKARPPHYLARTCLSYLVSNSLLEEEKVVLYPSQFGSEERSQVMLFTTRRGVGFLRSYLELARLAGNLGESEASTQCS